MKSIIKNFKILLVPVVAASLILSSCNKGLESFPEIKTPTTPPVGITLGLYIAGNSSYSLLDTALRTTGLNTSILNKPGSYTLFAPDNNAFKGALNALFSIPLSSADAVFIGALKNPAFKSTLTQILMHHIMVSQMAITDFPTSFPNVSYSSALPLDATGAIRMNLFPSARPGVRYINNVPVTAPTLYIGSNGIVHGVPAVVAPPQGTMKTLMAADATLSYFRAAVARADSGSTGLSKLDSLLNFGLTNMTVLAPNDAAFKGLIYNLVYAKAFAATSNTTIADAQANGAVAAGPAFLATNNVTTELVKGILVYHFFATQTADPSIPYQPNIRVFSVNMSALPAFQKTMLNNAFPTHPGVMTQATFTGPVVSGLKITGLGPLLTSTTVPYSGTPANVIPTATGMDRQAVNGVYYVIDRVLLPQ